MIMHRDQLDGLLTGNTLYVELPPDTQGGATCMLYHGADGRAALKLPAGLTLVGSWSLKDSHYVVDWENGPKNGLWALDKSDGAISLIEIASGKPRGRVTKLVPGNPEGI